MEPDQKHKSKDTPHIASTTQSQTGTITAAKDTRKEDEIKTKKVSLSIIARGNNFEISVKNQCLISEISQTTDNIISEISKSRQFKAEVVFPKPAEKIEKIRQESDEKQISFFAERLGVDPQKLEESGLLGIKDEVIQIIKVSKLKPMEASLLILAVKDLLFNQKPIAYSEWKDLCDANGIRSNSPLYMIASNAKNLGYINKEKYNTKEMLLIPKGIKFVKKAVEKVLDSNP